MDAISLEFIYQSLAKRFLPTLISFTWHVAFIIGILLAGTGLKKLADAATGKEAPRYQTGFIYFVVGILLIYQQPTLLISQQTVFGTSDPFLYADTITNASSKMAVEVIVLIIFFIGQIAFIRGIMILRFAGTHSYALQNALGKGVMLALVGLLAMNILRFSDSVLRLLGAHL